MAIDGGKHSSSAYDEVPLISGRLGPDTDEISDSVADHIHRLTDTSKVAIRTLIAMPAFNEAPNIAEAISASEKHADAVLVVDDGSEDNTASIASSLGAIVVKHESNGGYGAALRTIFSTARDLGVEELVTIDSDGQHNPEDIPRLLAELRKGNDVVIGSRFKECGGVGIPFYRKVGMKVLDLATRMAGSELGVTDTQSGFRAYGKRAVNDVHIGSEGMSAGSEILIQISDHRLKVSEVQIKIRYDLQDTSSENPIAHGVGVLMKLVSLTRQRRPTLFFGVPGMMLIMLGLIAGSYTSFQYHAVGQLSYSILTGSCVALTAGSLLTSVGIIRHSMIRKARICKQEEPKGRPGLPPKSPGVSSVIIFPSRGNDKNGVSANLCDVVSDEAQNVVTLKDTLVD